MSSTIEITIDSATIARIADEVEARILPRLERLERLLEQVVQQSAGDPGELFSETHVALKILKINPRTLIRWRIDGKVTATSAIKPIRYSIKDIAAIRKFMAEPMRGRKKQPC